jgi:hypothetical protein
LGKDGGVVLLQCGGRCLSVFTPPLAPFRSVPKGELYLPLPLAFLKALRTQPERLLALPVVFSNLTANVGVVKGQLSLSQLFPHAHPTLSCPKVLAGLQIAHGEGIVTIREMLLKTILDWSWLRQSHVTVKCPKVLAQGGVVEGVHPCVLVLARELLLEELSDARPLPAAKRH